MKRFRMIGQWNGLIGYWMSRIAEMLNLGNH